MSIRITGMYSGLDTESIISELVSAQSVKKSSLVKAQTKLSWKQDAWKALNTKIFDFYTNTLSNMRYQSSYMKKTTKISNTNAISVITSDSAVDGVRTVSVDQLAKGSNLTSAKLASDSGVNFSGQATLAQLRKFRYTDSADQATLSNLSGSFRVVGAQGQYVDFEVNENTTINDVVDMIKTTGLNANYDQESQRIFISSKNTGALNNFNLVANDTGGMNALACLGLLSAGDVISGETDLSPSNPKLTNTELWASYATHSTEYEELISDEIKSRQEAYTEENKSLTETNDKLEKQNDELKDANQEYFDDMLDTDFIGMKFQAQFHKTFSAYADELYGDGGLFDDMNAAAKHLDEVKSNEASTQDEIDAAQKDYDDAKAAYDSAKKQVTDFMEEIAYGPYVEKKDKDGNTVYEKVQKVDGDGNPMYEQVAKKDDDGNPVLDDDGNQVYENGAPIMEDKAVMVREGGLNKQWEDAKKAGTTTLALEAQVESVNKWYDAMVSLEQNKTTIASNEAKIEANTAKIADNELYLDDTIPTGETMSRLESKIRGEFDARVAAAQEAIDAASGNGAYAKMYNASKVNAQDARITVDGAEFTSMTNTFNINGMTITAMETTDREITMTTSTDTDGIYDMIKNFFSEYNKLINEMDSLYNADSSKGYEPLTSEEKEAMSESEIEEWEKKIKDSLLRRDSTLSTVSNAMVSILMQGAEVNGVQMYLSDFGINTLGYFVAKDNERNAYHIDGDADDADSKANEDKLRKMIANNPDTVMNFFTKLSTSLYDDLTSKMSTNTMSSAFTVYNDKQMKKDYESYKDKITKEEEKLNNMMDKWYKKFSAMEVAMSKLESRSSSLTSILGG